MEGEGGIPICQCGGAKVHQRKRRKVVKVVTECLERWPEHNRPSELKRTIQDELDKGWTLRAAPQCGAMIYLVFVAKEGLR
jgi:hypothetical protein